MTRPETLQRCEKNRADGFHHIFIGRLNKKDFRTRNKPTRSGVVSRGAERPPTPRSRWLWQSVTAAVDVGGVSLRNNRINNSVFQGFLAGLWGSLSWSGSSEKDVTSFLSRGCRSLRQLRGASSQWNQCVIYGIIKASSWLWFGLSCVGPRPDLLSYLNTFLTNTWRSLCLRQRETRGEAGVFICRQRVCLLDLSVLRTDETLNCEDDPAETLLQTNIQTFPSTMAATSC